MFLFFTVSVSLAQQAAYWHPVYDNYTTLDGLPSMELYNSMQDNEGYMWFASDRGVVRYNGSEFETYTTKDGLISNTVFKIDVDDKGRVWFLSDKPGFCYFENGEIKKYKHNDKIEAYLGEKLIQSYTTWQFKNDEVLFSTSHYGAIKIDENGTLTNPLDKAIYRELKCEILITEFDGILLNTRGSLSGFGNMPPLAVDIGEIQHQIMSDYSFYRLKIGKIQDDRAYMAFERKLYLFGKGEIKAYDFIKEIYSVFVDGDKLWVSFAGDGVKVFEINGVELKEKYHFFDGASISNVFKSREGHFWFTDLNNGLYEIQDFQVCKLVGSTELESSIRAIRENGENLILVDVENKFRIFDQQSLQIEHQFTNYLVDGVNGLVSLPTHDETFVRCYPRSDGSIQNATKVLKYANGKFIDYPYFERALEMFKLDNGSYVHCGDNVYTKDRSTDVRLSMKPISFEIDENIIWVGTNYGIKTIDLSTGTTLTVRNELVNGRINSIHKVGETVFFATHGTGVVLRRNGVFEKLIPKEGEIPDFVNQIVSSENGTLWLMENNGVTKLTLYDGEYYAQSYDVKQLNCEKFNDIYAGKDYVYLATNRGVLRILNDVKIEQKRIPQLHLNDIRVNDKLMQKFPFLLDHNYGTFLVNFDAVSFEHDPVVYRYRINESEEWIDLSENFTTLNSLYAGDYKCEIQASINGQDWTKSKSFEFTVLPPFWKTWWFLLAELIIGAAFLWWLALLRLRAVNRRHADKQKMMELQQEALTQQMNPHFIFNALGSVQNSILKGDSIQANKYLVKFSRLLRTGLNASRSQLIPIEEDLELMENYLSVEKTRLGENFTYVVDFKNKSANYSLFISPFLLQPFIENCIKHGIGEDHPAGRVTVIYEELDDRVQCTIEDNGAGREAAKSKQLSGHKSHGSDIAFERIDLFNRSRACFFERKIEDLYDSENNVVGTKVSFSVPLIKK